MNLSKNKLINIRRDLFTHLKFFLGSATIAATSKSPASNGNVTAGKQSPGENSGNQKSSGPSPTTSRAGSVINLNPFSGLLWERREPL